jgi:Short C-terminal domain
MAEGAQSPERGHAVASWSQAGLGTFSVYEDGTIERERFTPAGREVVVESVVGASAQVSRRGGRMLFRDTRRWFLTIAGPDVAIAVEIANYVNAAAAVRRFAEQVNEVARRLPPGAQGAGGPAAIPDQLRELAELRESGVLTAQEFEAKKAQLLEEM